MLVKTNATKRHNLIPRDTISHPRSTRRGWHKIADVGRMKRMSERRQDQEGGGMTTRITSYGIVTQHLIDSIGLADLS